MVLIYTLESFAYVPISLNILHDRKSFNLMNGNFLSCDVMSKIIDELYTYKANFYVIDLKEVVLGDSRCFKKFNDFLTEFCDVKVIFINYNEILSVFLLNDCKDFLIYDEVQNFIFNKKCHNQIVNINFVQQGINNLIANEIKRNIYNREEFLKSSNVFVNKYINIKNLFLTPSVYYLILFELALLVKYHYNGKFEKIVCCSYNGAVISTCLAKLLGLEVIYLMNLGPVVSINDIDMTKNISTNNRYLFVSDMICLGSELNIVNTIIKLSNSELIGSLSIVKYVNP